MTVGPESASMDGIAGSRFLLDSEGEQTMAGPSMTDRELADEIRETARHLTEAIDGLRREAADFRTDIKVEVARINSSLAWMRAIATIAGISMLGLLTMVYQAGDKAGRIESTVITLQKTTEEIKADLKARDDRIAAIATTAQKAAEESRKATDDLKANLKGHSDDMARLQAAVDHFNVGIDKINEMVGKAMSKGAR